LVVVMAGIYFPCNNNNNNDNDNKP
jgi:hypothetical protein